MTLKDRFFIQGSRDKNKPDFYCLLCGARSKVYDDLVHVKTCRLYGVK